MTRTRQLWVGLAALVFGVCWHMAALAIADRMVTTFPAVDDIILRTLPRIDLFGIGEVAFFIFIAVFAVTFFWKNKNQLAQLLLALGLFYGLRGLFLLLLPLGPPLDAFSPSERFTLYPYASHAFFPGGHFGVMLVMTWHTQPRSARWALVVAVLAFGIGSLLTRAHYTADLIGGAMLAYVAVSLAKKYVSSTQP